MKNKYKKIKAIMRISWQGNLAYRGYIMFWTFIELMPFLIMYFLWTYVYATKEQIQGYTLNNMITYYIIAYVVEKFTAVYIEWSISKKINNGSFSQFLVRPQSHRVYYLFSSFAEIAFRILISSPAFFVALLLIGDRVMIAAPTDMALFVLSIAVALTMNFFLSANIAYSAFWLEKADSVIYLRWSIAFYLSGSFLPLAFYGSSIQTVLSYLPFRYIVGFPIELYLGKLNSGQIMFGFGVGISWVFIMYVLNRIIFARGLKKFSAVGN